MAENSKIEWTDHTFNPWIGCTKVSDGCKHCYAEALMDKRYGKVEWGPTGQRVRTSANYWKQPRKWNREAAASGKRARVFCASLADVFEIHPTQDLDEWRHDLFMLIQQTPHLDWLLLTKRPENVTPYLMHGWGTDLPDNVWLGTSVENQEQAEARIPHLLKVPATVRFLSMEPLLGPVYLDLLDGVFFDGGMPFSWQFLEPAGINWVIVGGESGREARPMHPEWARAIRDRCVEAGVPFFFKQWGEWCPYDKKEHLDWAYSKSGEDDSRWRWLKVDGHEGPTWRKDLVTTLVKVGKKAAGRLLDGEEWNHLPHLDQNGQPMA